MGGGGDERGGRSEGEEVRVTLVKAEEKASEKETEESILPCFNICVLSKLAM